MTQIFHSDHQGCFLRENHNFLVFSKLTPLKIHMEHNEGLEDDFPICSFSIVCFSGAKCQVAGGFKFWKAANSNENTDPVSTLGSKHTNLELKSGLRKTSEISRGPNNSTKIGLK